jgi:hypothetical protein
LPIAELLEGKTAGGGLLEVGVAGGGTDRARVGMLEGGFAGAEIFTYR